MKSFISIEHFPMNMYASISVNGNLSEAVWMNCRCVMTLGLFGIDVLSVTQAYFIYLRKDEDCFAASISTLFHIIFGFASGTTTCLLYCDSWHLKIWRPRSVSVLLYLAELWKVNELNAAFLCGKQLSLPAR